MFIQKLDPEIKRLKHRIWMQFRCNLDQQDMTKMEKYFSFCETYNRAKYFLSIINHFYKHLRLNVACSWIKMLLSPIFCLNSTILNSFAEKKLFFFILFQIFSAKPGFSEYFLRTRFAGSTTFSTSDLSPQIFFRNVSVPKR